MLYYRPDLSAAADVIPFFDGDSFKLFYLRDFRNPEQMGEGTPWYLLETKDFLHYVDHGEALPRGGRDQQDLYVYTGSVCKADDLYYIFYTGHNPHYKAEGRAAEAIMRASSRDGIHWTKDHEFALFAPDSFEKHDWRDPFVFVHPETGEYAMLLAARLKDGPPERRGCTAIAFSRDLTHWTVKDEPFYAPQRFYTHECPDLFFENGWWYLVFSEFSDRATTRYVYSASLEGPWHIPPIDSLDNSVFYAAKTASDGETRYLFGWNRTRLGNADTGKWQWGGNIVVHKLTQNEDGTLAVAAPQPLMDTFGNPKALQLAKRYGSLVKRTNGWLLGDEAYAAASAGPLPDTALLKIRFTTDESLRECGLLLRANDDCEEGVRIRMIPAMNRMSFDLSPIRGNAAVHEKETECYAKILPGVEHELLVFISGFIMEVYLDNVCAMSVRAYKTAGSGLCMYSMGGSLLVGGADILTPGDL